MRLETNLEGREAIFRPYQNAIIEILQSIEYRQGSGEVWKKLQERDHKMSRATVIIFLNDLVEDGLADYEEKSGKGGFKKMYKLFSNDPKELDAVLVDRFVMKLFQIFPDNEKLKELLR